MSPRTVRNFWIAAKIDGRRSTLSGGPRGKDGGLCLTLYQRCRGSVAPSLSISCLSRNDGVLQIEIVPLLPLDSGSKRTLLRLKTKR
jgi:hypothetical protein